MKTLLRSLLAIVVLAGAVHADAKKQSPAGDKKLEMPKADADKLVELWNKFVDVVVASKEDCGKLAKDTNALFDANAELIKRIQDLKAQNRELPQAQKEKMLARQKEVTPTMKKCGGDPNVKAAMMRLEAKPAAKSETKKK